MTKKGERERGKKLNLICRFRIWNPIKLFSSFTQKKQNLGPFFTFPCKNVLNKVRTCSWIERKLNTNRSEWNFKIKFVLRQRFSQKLWKNRKMNSAALSNQEENMLTNKVTFIVYCKLLKALLMLFTTKVFDLTRGRVSPVGCSSFLYSVSPWQCTLGPQGPP